MRRERSEKRVAVASAVSGLLNASNPSLFSLGNLNPSTATAKITSIEQNVRRLLDDTGLTQQEFAKIMIDHVLCLSTFELIIDRTNWELGSHDTNYMVISVIWNNVAIPIYWELLDNNGGSSNDKQRTNCLQWVIDVFGAWRISNFYADREFPSENLIGFLLADNYECSTYLEVETSKLKLLKTSTANNSPLLLTNEQSKLLKLKHRLTVVMINKELYLAELLQTNEIRLFKPNPLFQANNPSDLHLCKFKFTPNDLISYFHGYQARSAINFVARCKASTLCSSGNKKLKLALIFKQLTQQNNTYIAKAYCRAFSHRVFISARLNQKNEFVFLVSNQKLDDPFIIYKRRWHIEVMFAKLKTVGFNLESTKITSLIRLSNLMQLLALAYLCCCKLGIALTKIKPVKFKSYGPKDNKYQSPQFSYFMLGFKLLKNFITSHLFDTASMAKLLYQVLDYNLSEPNNFKDSNALNIILNSY